MMVKIIFFKKNTILIHFKIKNTLKNNSHHILKHPLNLPDKPPQL